MPHDVGFTCATIARSAVPIRRRRCSIIRAIEPASIHRRISAITPGFLQADAYGGYNKLYEQNRKPGPLLEAACWVHARRPFFVLADVAENARRKAQGKTPGAISPLAAQQIIDLLLEEMKQGNAELRLARDIPEGKGPYRPCAGSGIVCAAFGGAGAMEFSRRDIATMVGIGLAATASHVLAETAAGRVLPVSWRRTKFSKGRGANLER